MPGSQKKIECPLVLGGVKLAGKALFSLVQLAVFIYTLTQLYPVKEKWLDTVPEEATVLTVQLDEFWGPVHVLIPTRCSRFAENDQIVKEQAVRSLSEAGADDEESKKQAQQQQEKGDEDAGKHAEQDDLHDEQRDVQDEDAVADDAKQEDPGADNKKQKEKEEEEEDKKEFDSTKQVAEDVGVDWDSSATHVIVNRCGETMAFKKIPWYNTYFAMTWMSGRDTMEELRDTRCKLLTFLTCAAVMESVVTFGYPILMALGGLGLGLAYQIVPESTEGAGDRPGADGRGRSLQMHETEEMMQEVEAGIQQAQERVPDGLGGKLYLGFKMMIWKAWILMCSKIGTLQSSAALLSLFYIFWNDDYYVTSFIPAKVYIIAVMSVVMFCGFQCAFPFVPPEGALGMLMCAGCLGAPLIVLVIIPFYLGYGLYNWQYLWQVVMAPAMNSEFHLQLDTAFESGEQLGETELPRVVAMLVSAHCAEILVMACLEFFTPFVLGSKAEPPESAPPSLLVSSGGVQK